ncbi:hypothetical protein ACTWKD_11065 [Halanaerobium saccharolyticum]|jgi:hypothetical protein|uniref:hypothetical protein n=1 Tax=Halanaerobium saccharolyticum TaxID=43595 RepID=UPI003FCCF108
MKDFNSLLILLMLLIIIPLLSFTIFAQTDQVDFSFNNDQFTNYNFNVNSERNYSNYNSLKENKKLAVVNQKGNFNQAAIWQKSQSIINDLSSALIVQVGNDNQALIKQFLGSNTAVIEQYGYNNRAEIEQLSRNNNLRISQFGNNKEIKVKQN